MLTLSKISMFCELRQLEYLQNVYSLIQANSYLNMIFHRLLHLHLKLTEGGLVYRNFHTVEHILDYLADHIQIELV